MNNRILKIADEQKEINISKTMKELTSLEITEAHIKNNLFKKSFQRLQGIYENVLKIITCINTVSISLNTVGENQKQLEKKVNNICSSQKILSDNVAELSSKTETAAINLHQTRLLTERVAQRIDNISQEFIDRHIIEPILKDFGSFYNTLRTMKQTDKIDMNYLVEQFDLILDSYEIKLIKPQSPQLKKALT